MDKPEGKSIEVQRLEALEFFLGWPKKRFAESLGLSPSNYSKIINNGMSLPSKALYQIYSVHKVDLDWIFGKIESETPVFVEESKEEERVRQLEQELLKTTQELLKYKSQENEELKRKSAQSNG